MQKLKTELEDSEAEHEKLAQTVLDSTSKIEELEVALASARAQAGTAESKVKDAETKVKAAEDRSKALEEKSKVLSAKMDGMEAERVFALEAKKGLESVSHKLHIVLGMS